MKVFRVDYPDGPTQKVHVLGLRDDDWPEPYRRLVQGNDGRPMSGSWTPPPSEFSYNLEEVGTGLIPVDVPEMLGFEFLLRPRAAELLSDPLSRWGELLPVACDEDDLVGFHCTNVVDALDLDRTNVKESGGRITIMGDVEFRPGTIGNNEIFCVPEDPSTTFYSESFVEWFETLGLTGIGWYCKAEVEP